MDSLKSRSALLLGLTLLLASPLVAMTPKFTPSVQCPPGGTLTGLITVSFTTINGTISVTTLGSFSIPSYPTTQLGACEFIIEYPFTPEALVLGAVGLVLAILWVHQNKGKQVPSLKVFSPLLAIGAALAVAGILLGDVMISGPGWSIGPYALHGLYLFTLGIGIGLYAILTEWANLRSAVMLTVGLVATGWSLLIIWARYQDFLPRCINGCNSVLAESTLSTVIMFGLLLAGATFLIGFALASHKKEIWTLASGEKSMRTPNRQVRLSCRAIEFTVTTPGGPSDILATEARV